MPSASNWSPPLYFLSMLGLPPHITPIHKFSIHVFVPPSRHHVFLYVSFQYLAQRRCSVSISRIYFWNLFENSFKDIPQNADSLDIFFYLWQDSWGYSLDCLFLSPQMLNRERSLGHQGHSALNGICFFDLIERL